jgi:hypothetical protein
MKTRSALISLFAVAALTIVASHTQAAEPARKSSTAAAQASLTGLRKVDYEQLERNVGSKIVVRTTNNTTRHGTLIRYTGVNITIQLGPENGAIELVIPRNTIREALLEIAPADPLFPNEQSPYEGNSGAKKN